MLGLKGKENFRAPKNKKKREEENVSEIYFNGSRQLLIITRSHGRDNGVRILIAAVAESVFPFVSFFIIKNYCIHPAQIVRMCRT
jgi:hypothetical protein